MRANFASVETGPNLSVKAAISTAISLMRAEGADSDRLGRLTPGVLEALDNAGAFRMRLPERFGGSNLSVFGLLDAVIEVSKGSGSAGWIVWVSNVNDGIALSYPDEVVAEIFGDVWRGPRFAAVALSTHSMGKARDVSGGYMVKGLWNFASGIAHTKYFLAGVDFEDGRERKVCILPVAAGHIVDDWKVVGMRASSSNSFMIESEVFVSERWTMPVSKLLVEMESVDARFGTHAGAWPVGLNQGIAIGLAYGALEIFLDLAKRKKPFGLPYKTMAESPMIQTTVGAIYAKIAAADALLHRYCVAAAVDGPDANRQIVPYAARLAGEAVETLHLLMGSSGIYESNVLMRFARDMTGLSLHSLNRWEFTAENLGRIVLGLEPHSVFS